MEEGEDTGRRPDSVVGVVCIACGRYGEYEECGAAAVEGGGALPAKARVPEGFDVVIDGGAVARGGGKYGLVCALVCVVLYVVLCVVEGAVGGTAGEG